MIATSRVAISACLIAIGCGDNAGVSIHTCDGIDHCVAIAGGDVQSLLDAANATDGGTTLVLGAGTFAMTNSLTIRSPSTHVIGQGIDVTVLDFAGTTTQVNGVDVIGDDFLIEDLTVQDSPKDGIRVEASDGVVYQRVHVTWTTPSDPTNGSYGIYPVHSQNVLIEGCLVENASDAGLYVGQSQHVVVHDNTVTQNVAGLEIENCEYADVFDNTAVNNTCGIVAFDLPGNPIVGRDIRLRDNTIEANNHPNFAAGGVVMNVPSGIGTFAMASRRVEITGNTYSDNASTDIAVVSGLVIESDPTQWELPTATLGGDYQDLELMPGTTPGTITNFRSENILVANNRHFDTGTLPDVTDPLMLGILLILVYEGKPVDAVLYDSIGESMFDSTDPAKNSNDNHICVGGDPGSFASMSLATQSVSTITPFFRPAPPFAPFDCNALVGGPVAPVALP